ncbi:hypothetical protein COSHB9_07530 [Companilactobacillus alimentarius]|uniref:DUF1129 domain-containing protein n=1 Tax=Companilactobacillus alimentarius DSM 20249 TaxID=1423720 RepID=A0A2K9HPE5_9LACO|nr:hypothetical protein [Companilactobacillus alimentarius]AUI72303.1 hypothetical protein LA20249_08960 [Companilactobacillus alimentarius DSM 20249]KRK75987.1 hypothetical protein FC67_GL000756 [Companilactobacillus alimentarius DSM 20249]MDT6952879.1 hypothetical protein [Companilactobacillus alimentarius]GEO45679.1 hypothetical protein LAL01_19110 [Companilactobacillus alimentarius]
MTKTQELIAANNKLRKQLNTDNAKYYDKLLIYIRTSSLIYDDFEVENKLLEILQDIIDAQTNSQNAIDYFGQEPIAIADELITNFTKISWSKRYKFFGTLFAISVLWTLITQLSGQSKQLNLVPFLLNGLALIVFITGIFWFIHQTTYWKILDNKILNFLFMWLFMFLVIGIFVGIQFVTPTLFSIPVTDSLIVAVNSLILVLGLLMLTKKSWRTLTIAILPMITVITVSNVLKVLLGTEILTLTTILVVFSVIWFFGFFFYHLRKIEN